MNVRMERAPIGLSNTNLSCRHYQDDISLLDQDDNMNSINKAVEADKSGSKFYRFVLPSLLLSFVVVAVSANVFVLPSENGYENLPYFKSLQLSAPGTTQIPASTYAGHKTLLPLSGNDYLGFSFVTLALVIAGAAGLGGGGMLIPIYILVMNFNAKSAIPLAAATVLGGSIANTMLNSVKRHPNANRPLIDWDMVLMMEPMAIAGAIIGAFLNKLLPQTVIIVLLVLLLGYTSKNMFKKGVKMYKKETEDLLKANQEKGGNEPLLSNGNGHVGKEGSVMNGTDQEALKKILKSESKVPKGNVFILIFLTSVVLAVNVAKGGGGFPSPLGITCGSFTFWASTAFMLIFILLIVFFVRQYQLERYELKEKLNYKYVKGDVKWDHRATFVYPALCTCAGLIAGIFGLGGGIFLGPLMIAMEVDPRVSRASLAPMIFMTAFTATASFVVFGLLIPDYGIVCLILGYVDTVVAQFLLYFVMHKFKRNSFIVFAIGIVILLSTILMTISGVEGIMSSGASGGGGSICASGQ